MNNTKIAQILTGPLWQTDLSSGVREIRWCNTDLCCCPVCVCRSHSGDRLFRERCDGDVVLASWEHWWDRRGQCQTQPVTDPEARGTSPSAPSFSPLSNGKCSPSRKPVSLARLHSSQEPPTYIIWLIS